MILSTQWVLMITKSRSVENRRLCMQIFSYLSRNEETSSRVLEVSSQTRDDPDVPSCVAVVEDYDEADKGHDQDNLTGDKQGSEDLPEIGTWGQKEDAADVKFSEA